MSKTPRKTVRLLVASLRSGAGSNRNSIAADLLQLCSVHTKNKEIINEIVSQLGDLLITFPTDKASLCCTLRTLADVDGISELARSCIQRKLSVNAIILFLSLEDVSIRIEVARLLSVVVKNNPEAYDQFFADKRNLQALCHALDSSSPGLTREVVRLVANVTFLNRSGQSMVIQSDFMSKLSTWLASEDSGLLVEVTRLISNLCQICDENRAKLLEVYRHVVSDLLVVLSKGLDVEIDIIILDALSNLVKLKNAQNSLTEYGFTRICFEKIGSQNQRLDDKCLKLLSKLISSDKKVAENLCEVENLKRLLQVLVLQSELQQDTSLEATQKKRIESQILSTLKILNLLIEFDSNMSNTLRNLGAVKLTAGLLTVDRVEVQTAAAKLVGRMAFKNPANSLDYLNKNTVLFLSKMLEDGSINVRKESAIALSNLADGSPRIQNQLNKFEVIPKIISFLNQKNQECILELWGALKSITRDNLSGQAQICSADNFRLLLAMLGQSKNESLKVDFSSFFCSVFLVSKQYISAALEAGLMPTLIEYLVSSNHEVSLNYLKLLHLILCNEDNRTVFEQEQGVIAVKACLESDDPSILTQALACIEASCDYHPSLPSNYRKNGVTTLIRELLDHDDIRVVSSALAALNQLVLGDSKNKKTLSSISTIKSISYAFGGSDLWRKQLAIQLISQLVFNDRNMAICLRKNDFLREVVALFKEEDLDTKQYAASTISTVAKLDTRSRDALRDLGSLAYLFELVLDETIRVTALSALSELTSKNLANQNFFKNENRKARFIQCVTTGTPPARFFAERILDNLGFDLAEYTAKRRRMVGAESLSQFHYIPSHELGLSGDSRPQHPVIGRGSFARVLRHKWRGHQVAIKYLEYQGLRPDSELMDDLMYEGALMMSLLHPNIVQVYGVCTDQGCLSIAMEFVPNGSLFDKLYESDVELPWWWRLMVSKGIADALAYMHSKKVIHRDMKSCNVLLDESSQGRVVAKVTDFGLSRVSQKVVKTLTTAGLVGSVRWCAPELQGINGGLSYTPAVDVYAVAMVFYEILCRMLPWQLEMDKEVVRSKDIDKQLEIINRAMPIIPEGSRPDYSALIEKCWFKNPVQRMSMKEVSNHLDSMISADSADYDARCQLGGAPPLR